VPKQPTLEPLPDAKSIPEVIDSIDKIIAWSIANSSRVGYFAALYKRITLAVQKAIADKKFQDGARMERFDYTFANRYFNALNRHFHADVYGEPTETWQLSLQEASNEGPIIVQHLLGACNAHIALDLGITADKIAAGDLPGLEKDFNAINEVLASQSSDVVKSIDKVSRVLADVDAVLQNYEIDLIDGSLKILRDNAWEFAGDLSGQPGHAQADIIADRDHELAQLGQLIYRPGIPMAAIFDAVAEEEQRNVAKNIRALDEIASAPFRSRPWICGLLQSTCRELRGLASATLEPAFAAIGMRNTSGRTNHR
jgi:Family of unknown function (DUF5995)